MVIPLGCLWRQKTSNSSCFLYQSSINVDLFSILLGYFSAVMFFINVAINIEAKHQFSMMKISLLSVFHVS
jgi:hypothetical protein